MKETIQIYGSIAVFVAFAITGTIAAGMFVDGAWILDRIGLVGLVIELVVINVCAVLSLLYDLPGNARKAFDRGSR